MYYMFFSTNDVFLGEEILRKHGVKHRIVPTPIKEKIYCGVCIWSNGDEATLKGLFKGLTFEIKK